MNITLIIGLVAAFFTTFAFLPQSIRAIKTKHTKDLSLPMIVMLEIGVVIWIIYGSLISDIPLLAANTISFIFVTITLVLKLKHG